MRHATEQELVRLTDSGARLGRDSCLATSNLYPKLDRSRRRFREGLIEEYVSDTADVGRDGAAALITAGPPGAGKSTCIEKLGLGSGYRIIDADKIKEKLLEKAIEDGIFEDLLRIQLPDCRSILPNELAVLVHQESADLANQILRRSLYDRVNVVIEGTLSWSELCNRYLKWLISQEYRYLTVVDVEVDYETAIAQASDRWWGGRQAAFNGLGTSFGGRFTPPSAINSSYPNRHLASSCNTNAVALFNDGRAELFEETTLYVYDNISATYAPEVYIMRDGKSEGQRPEPLNESRFGKGLGTSEVGC